MRKIFNFLPTLRKQFLLLSFLSLLCAIPAYTQSGNCAKSDVPYSFDTCSFQCDTDNGRNQECYQKCKRKEELERQQKQANCNKGNNNNNSQPQRVYQPSAAEIEAQRRAEEIRKLNAEIDVVMKKMEDQERADKLNKAIENEMYQKPFPADKVINPGDPIYAPPAETPIENNAPQNISSRTARKPNRSPASTKKKKKPR